MVRLSTTKTTKILPLEKYPLYGIYLCLSSHVSFISLAYLSLQVAELALSRLFAGLPVDSLVGSMLGLMDPVNRMETWEEEEELKLVCHFGHRERERERIGQTLILSVVTAVSDAEHTAKYTCCSLCGTLCYQLPDIIIVTSTKDDVIGSH